MIKKKYSRYFSLGLVLTSLSGCFGLFDSGADKIIGRYNVCWIDLVSSRSICFASKEGEGGGGEEVPGYVFAVGHNDNFILAKQHPLKDANKVDPLITNYYIIDMKNDWYGEKGVFGPLTKSNFDSLCHKYGIRDIKFDQTYPETP